MTAAQPGSRVDRLLRWFADVRPGEGPTALLLALNIFLILTSYYVLKPVREALILGQGSPELKTYMSLGQIAVMSLAVPWYGRLAGRLERRTLVNRVTWFFVACLALFYVLGRSGVPVGHAYFLWIGVFNLMIVAQFWSFANDIYSRPEGERLFPLVGFGASAGAVAGALVAARLIQWLGVYELLLTGAVLLALQLQITNYVDSHTPHRTQARNTREDASGTPHGNAFGLVFRTPYLLLMAVMLLLLSTVDAIGEYVLGSIVKTAAEAEIAAGRAGGATLEALIGTFYSRYFALVNVASLLIQLFVVSRLVKLMQVRRAVIVEPTLSFLAYAALVVAPSLPVALTTKVAEKGTDYSLGNTVRNMLYLPCTREEKYSAKQVIDSFFFRMGDVMSAAVVFIGTSAALVTQDFAMINVVLAALLLTMSVLVGRAYARRKDGLPASSSPGSPPAPARPLRRRLAHGTGAVLALGAMAQPAHAQETRSGTIAAQQAEKAQTLHEYEPPAFERTLVDMRQRLFEEPGGFFPFFGSVYGGGGFTLGAGYRRHYSESALWDVKGLYSFKNYKLIQLGTATTSLFGGPVRAEAHFGWRDAPQIGYYGVGMATDQEDRANYRMKELYTGVSASTRAGFAVFEGAFSYEDYRLMPGKGSAPSIETVYTPFTAPALGAEPAYVHTEATVAFDSRRAPGYSRTGGYYGLTFHDYADLDGDASFDLLRVDAVQHIPILRETWVISLRATATTSLDDSDLIPYFMLPSLGSGSTLRAYDTGRFRDRHSLLTSAEWRWIPNRLGLDMALFFDAGKVVSRRSDLDFSGLRHDWGAGIRFHTPLATVLRIDVARGSEGLNIVFGASAAF